MKRFFKIYVRMSIDEENFYLSDGCLAIKNDSFEGYMTDDYIKGNYKNQTIYFKMFMHEFQTGACYYSEFQDKIDFLEFPGTYNINCLNSEATFQLNVEEEITDKSDIQRIQGTLEEIREFYS